MAWRIALERPDGPVALALTRQKLPTLDRTEVAAADGALRGAYILWQRGEGEPDAIVIATGSEVHLALEAAQSLAANVRVVSMPCWELFEEQDDDYQESVLPARRRDAARGRGRRHARLGALRERDHRYRPFRGLGAVPAGVRRVRDHRRGDRRGARGELAMRVAGVLRPPRRRSFAKRCWRRSRRRATSAVDLGVDTDAVRVDYPDKALELGMAIRRGEVERGVLVCGSGVGASIAASKIPGIRAAICHDTYSAHQGVEHDDMNVLCLGSEIVGGELARELVRTFLGARFVGGGRYADRLEKVAELERMSDG